MLGRIGKYELLEKISEGGMGELYRARAVGPGGFERMVALKRIRRASDRDQSFIEMFVEEAKVASLLSHQNLVHLYDFGSEGEVHYLAMELVEGRDLAKALARGRQTRVPFPIPAAVRVAHQTLLGLDHLHRLRHKGEPLQLVHRDVSPQNILLSFDGAVKVTDFGIVRMKRQERLTHVGVVKGKLGYLSPEQIADLPIDSRSDLFSLGIVLWECLTGARLFPGAADAEIVRQVLEKPLRPPSAYNAEVSHGLDEVVMRALTRDRDRRFASAAEMAEALGRLSESTFGEAELAAEVRRLFPENAGERELGLGSSAELVGRLASTAAPTVAPQLDSASLTLGKQTRSMGPSGPSSTSSMSTEGLPEARTELAILPKVPGVGVPGASRAPRRAPVWPWAGGALALLTVVGLVAFLRLGAGPAAPVASSVANQPSSVTTPTAPAPLAVARAEPPSSVTTPTAPAPLAVARAEPSSSVTAIPSSVTAPSVTAPQTTPAPLQAAPPVDPAETPNSPANRKVAAAAPATLAVIQVHHWVEVLVDGKSRGFSPGHWTVSARSHEITLRNRDASLERHFQVRFASGKTVTLSDEKAPADAPAPP